MKAIILGTKRGVQRLDSSKSMPAALVQDRSGGRLLDWTLHALSEVGIHEIFFVGGYHIEKMVQEYPTLSFYYDPDWEQGTDFSALKRVAELLKNGPCLILYDTTAFRSNVINSLINEKVSISLALFDNSADAASPAEGLLGMGAFDAVASAKLAELLQAKEDSYPNSLQSLAKNLGCQTVLSHPGADMVQIRSSLSLSNFIFGTKARTLRRLRPLLKKSRILEQVSFPVSEWRCEEKSKIQEILDTFGQSNLVVRSSALAEDTMQSSQAGHYHSELKVSPSFSAIQSAVENVIAHFSCEESNGADEVLVQPYLENVTLSGVVFSRDMDTGAPYLMVNYDESGSTNSITAGECCDLHLAVISLHKDSTELEGSVKPELLYLREVVDELCELTGMERLDIEFAFVDDCCVIFQVRPLVGKDCLNISPADIGEQLAQVEEFITALQADRPGTYGKNTILTNMSDWNPAEIIGVNPRPLAWSLYRHLITDQIWGRARAEIGYKDTSSEPLIVSLAGHPYVDTRASFNSFLPAHLRPELAIKIVDYCVDQLRAHPEYHDKIEFNIALTCKDFCFAEHVVRLKGYGFSDKEIDEYDSALTRLTNDILCGHKAPIDEQIAKVNQLAERRSAVLMMKKDSLFAKARAFATLLDDCRDCGTLPFSILARYAFIASSLLNSLIERKVFSTKEVEHLHRCLPSVTTALADHFSQLSQGSMSMDSFIEIYGHLRPGTYDITSLSYAENPDFYFKDFCVPDIISERVAAGEYVHDLFDGKKDQIEELLQEVGLTCSVDALRVFITRAIPARENAKFEFTKNLSHALNLIAEYGASLGFSREEMSFTSIATLIDSGINSPVSSFKRELGRKIGRSRKRHLLHRSIKLPHILLHAGQVYAFEHPACLPNYITSKNISAPLVDLAMVDEKTAFSGCIILIESADPGFDWIFSRNISGLITKYGGAASHMSIRAAELGIPAAIGCGEKWFSALQKAEFVELNCATQKMHVVR